MDDGDIDQVRSTTVIPKVGIVIGHYNSLNYLELNLATLRRHCPDVPILVSDDASNALTYKSASLAPSLVRTSLQNLVRRFDAELIVAKRRLGHQFGDWSAIVHGMQWAGKRQIDVLFKLSQRCIVDTSDWAVSCARSMMDQGYDLLTTRILESANALMTFFLAIRVSPKTQAMWTPQLHPRNNMERHVFALSNQFGLRTGQLDTNAFSLLHRLLSKASDFESLARSHAGKLEYDLPFHIGP